MENTKIIKSTTYQIQIKHWKVDRWVHYLIRTENDNPRLVSDGYIIRTKIEALFGVLSYLPVFCFFPKFVCGFTFPKEMIQVYYYDGKMDNPYVR